MDATHDLYELPRPPNTTTDDVLHAPWSIDHDEDYGITVTDSRGFLVRFESFEEKSIREREAIVARMHEEVLRVNSYPDLLAALAPFAAFAEKAEAFVDARVKDGGSPILPTRDFRLADFRRAVAAIAKATGAAP